MTKKPAILSDSLLSHRPRKGEAKPQTENQAAAASALPALQETAVEQATVPSSTGATSVRRRRRISEKTQQLNLRVSEETLERFTQLADTKNVIFGDLLVLLLDAYQKK
jgi:hypothetical protein